MEQDLAEAVAVAGAVAVELPEGAGLDTPGPPHEGTERDVQRVTEQMSFKTIARLSSSPHQYSQPVP